MSENVASVIHEVGPEFAARAGGQTRPANGVLRLSAIGKIGPKEGHYVGVEIFVESNTIKVRGIGTDS